MAQDKKYISLTLLSHFFTKLRDIFAQKNHTHNYAGSSSEGGSATSAVKLTTGRTINGVTFDGTKNISIPATSVDSTQLASGTDLNTVTKCGFYYAIGGSACKNVPSGVEAFGLEVLRTADGWRSQRLTAYPGALIWLREGNDGTWKSWGRAYTTSKKPTPSEIGAAATSHGTHVTWATVLPKANGTAAVGTSNKVAREDHVHPIQTTVSGNAGTATKMQTARKIGNALFDGTKDITLSAIGAAPESKSAIITLYKSGWTTSAPYTQTVTVSGMRSSLIPIAGIYFDTSTQITATQEKETKKAAGYVTYIDTQDGSVMVTCVSQKPTYDFKLQLKW